MTPEESVLLDLVRDLERAGIPYMVAGSIASSHHGRPRATDDADIVIDPVPGALEAFVRAVASRGLYVDPARARDALVRRRQFNVIDTVTGWKIDLIVRKERPFSVAELARRTTVELVPGERVDMATPEDTIVSKLEWAKAAGGSEKQLLDVAGVVAANAGLDRSYVERWVNDLGVGDLWAKVRGGS